MFIEESKPKPNKFYIKAQLEKSQTSLTFVLLLN